MKETYIFKFEGMIKLLTKAARFLPFYLKQCIEEYLVR